MVRMAPLAPPPAGALLRRCMLFRRRPEPRRGSRRGWFPIVFLSCSAGLGSRVLFQVSTRPIPMPVDYRKSDRVGLGLSRLTPFALLGVLTVNRVDKKRFGAANPPRHGCGHL